MVALCCMLTTSPFCSSKPLMPFLLYLYNCTSYTYSSGVTHTYTHGLSQTCACGVSHNTTEM